MRNPSPSVLPSKLVCGRICAITLLMSVVLVPTAFSADRGPNGRLAAALDAYMQARVRANNFSGAVLVARGGKILLTRGYGEADREKGVPNGASTKFRIGSITKQFTATLVMQLQERHQLQLEDTICRYLDPCPETWASITLRHLLSHTSGVPNFTDDPDFIKQSEMLHRSLDQVITLFRDKPLDFAPGTNAKYSNSGYLLLGAIIEKVTGKRYEDVLRDQILLPLKMSDTGFDHHETILSRRAAGYSAKSGAVVNAAYVDTSWAYSAGAMYSTTLDMYKWDRALYTDSVLPQAALKEMWTPVRDNYGYGWGVSQSGEGSKKRLELTHDGGIAGFSAHISRYPGDDAVVIVLANFDAAQAGAVGNALAAILYGESYLTPTKTAASSVSFERYVGDYEVEKQGVIRFSRKDEKLYLQLMSVPGQPTFLAAVVSDSKIVCENINATIEFKAGESSGRDEMVIDANGGKTVRVGRRVVTQDVHE
jgi:D-alanyl-D-alanine carboxypeptidase